MLSCFWLQEKVKGTDQLPTWIKTKNREQKLANSIIFFHWLVDWLYTLALETGIYLDVLVRIQRVVLHLCSNTVPSKIDAKLIHFRK